MSIMEENMSNILACVLTERETLENFFKYHHFCILLMLTVAIHSSYCFLGHVELLQHYKPHLIYVAATLLRGNTQMCQIMLLCVSFLLIM